MISHEAVVAVESTDATELASTTSPNVPETTTGVTSSLALAAKIGHRPIDEGHELGNHTKSHQAMLKLSRADIRSEIVGGGQALIPFIGSIEKWFRPSGTDVPNDAILEEAGLAGYTVSVGYDIDSRDYTEPGAPAVVARVTKGLHPGAIVSLHFGHRDTIDAIPADPRSTRQSQADTRHHDGSPRLTKSSGGVSVHASR